MIARRYRSGDLRDLYRVCLRTGNSGDDATALALILLGGDGVISVTANVAPRLMHEMCEAALDADLPRAIEGLNGQSLEGRPLTVNEARPPRNDFSRPRNGGSERDGFRRQQRY